MRYKYFGQLSEIYYTNGLTKLVDPSGPTPNSTQLFSR